ncbi:MAG: glycine--tRNA ligase [Phycisphaerae bacterium]|nr:glycine--tRNA ligase [Phycisphaerae bacterium]
MDKLTALCKRRGFIYQSSEIYGGIGGFWDYGPLGVELKRNIKDLWWHDMVTNPPIGPDGHEVEMVGVDCSIIMNPKVWEASGHATGFADPMVDCKSCKARFRLDKVFHVVVSRAAGATELAHFSVEADSAAGARDAAQTQAKKLAKKHGGGEVVVEAIPFKDVIDAQLATLKCPACDAQGSLTEPRAFNLMFETFVGAVQDASAKAFLRPETAQGIFANFKNVLDTTRVKVPFGIAQVGKSFRNEINPRNYTFRSREFEQMEIEFFCHAADSMQWYEFWRNVRYNWYVNLGLKSEKLRLRDQGPEELAHYSKACADIEYMFPFSEEFQELEGVAHRGCFDLTQHQQHSGKDLTYFDNDAWERDKANFPTDQQKDVKNKEPYRFLPTVIEPSAGADRATLAFLCEAYTEDQAPNDKGQMETRVLMRFHPKLAPTKVAVFPLVNKEGMPEIAEAIYRDVKRHMTAFYDDKGAIGRRYRRQDEVGTPFCVTVDGDTLKDGTVTIRDRDSLAQVRVSKDGVRAWLREKLGH